MMQDLTGKLKDLCGDVPVEVLRYFDRIKDGSWSNLLGLELNLLPLQQALELTRTFRDFDEVVIALRGLMLDDADTSNHHVYLAHPACQSSILYRAHDGDSNIVFPTLDEFLRPANPPGTQASRFLICTPHSLSSCPTKEH